jgi:hypothetical protein
LAHLVAHPSIRGGGLVRFEVAQIAHHVATGGRDLVEYGSVPEGRDGAVAGGRGPVDTSSRQAWSTTREWLFQAVHHPCSTGQHVR